MSNYNYIVRLRDSMLNRSCSKDEIKKCCQYAETLLSKNLPVLFDVNHVREVLRLYNIDLNAYHTFPLFQVNKIRTITAPSVAIKSRQKWILHNILKKINVSPHVHGFETGCSIKTNALAHSENPYVLCIDIEDFFPSINREMIYSTFLSFGYTASASSTLTDICSCSDSLPQGAPTSPLLSNIIFRPIDDKLSILAASEDIVYTRYADDLTFSAQHNLDNLLPKVAQILKEHGFQINKDKIHFYKPGIPKRITGLVVQNGTVRVPKSFKKRLRQEIYYCNKYGVLTHLENVHATHFINYREHLYGKAYYVHMIEPEVGAAFLDALDGIYWP